mmetsp:Transcript_111843/g.280177  ORF Transcript_111843/g.280177 Transcript_111843/m.280177 type:complete len:403 (-) Transcript_111843:111-1319(-)
MASRQRRERPPSAPCMPRGAPQRQLLQDLDRLRRGRCGFVVACHPLPDVLVGVEGGGVAVATVGTQAKVVRHDGFVVDSGDAKEVHAIRHVLVLAPIVGCRAIVAPHRPLLDAIIGKDLESAVHHVANGAIHNVHFVADVWVQVPADTVRDQHSVWVDLQGEGVIPPDIRADHGIPRVHEELSVAGGVVDRDGDRGSRELNALGGADSDAAIGGKQRSRIATEDADSLVMLRLDEADLVSCGPQDGETIQRREALRGDSVAPRPQRLARPSLVVVVRVRAGFAPILALSPILVLLIALHIHANAAMRLRAISIDWRAHVVRPLWQCPARHRGRRWGPLAIGLAAPIGVGAGDFALPEIVVLQKALLPSILATTHLGAVPPAGDALLLDPSRRALLGFAQLPA